MASRPQSGCPLSGADVIGTWLSRFPKLAPAGAVLSVASINGDPALRMDVDGVLDTAMSFVVENGRITRIFAIRNPAKLTRLESADDAGQVTRAQR